MRDALRPLEGQKIVYVGRLKERAVNSGGGWDICLAAVEIRPLRTDIPLQSVEPIRLDHVWLRMEKRELGFKGMLRRMEGAAVVGWYARSDGSIDLGLRPIPGFDLDGVWIDANNAMRRSDVLDTLFGASGAIEAGTHVVWSWTTTADHCQEALLKATDRFKRQEAMNFGAQLIAPANGPCRKLRAADPFAGLRRRSRRVA